MALLFKVKRRNRRNTSENTQERQGTGRKEEVHICKGNVVDADYVVEERERGQEEAEEGEKDGGKEEGRTDNYQHEER